MRETKDIEFKEAVSNSFLKTVSAYANYGGGKILFGISDSGDVMGVPNAVEVAIQIENKINDTVRPQPEFSLDIQHEKRVVTLTVKEGAHKPYFYHSKAYRRNDSSTVEVDGLELQRLILKGRNIQFESLPAERQDLSFDTLKRHLREFAGIQHASLDVLKTLELVDATKSYCKAGELLADENTFPGIDAVRFGEGISIILDRKTFEHMSVLDQYSKAIEMFRAYYVYDEVRGSERLTRYIVPEEAFREAVANALVHRTWDVGAHIRMSMHPDRIEVASPGGLPDGISKEEYLADKISVLRNPILANVLYRLRVIERFGTGVARIKEAYSKSASKPMFEVLENSITVTLPITREEPELSDDELIVYQALDKAFGLSSSNVARLVGFGRTKTVKLLGRLVDEGYAIVSGAGRGTTYFKA